MFIHSVWWFMSTEQKWKFVTKEKAERSYRGYLLVLRNVPVPRRRIDIDSGDFEDDIWKWFVYFNDNIIRQGYANTYEEATKIAEFNAREHQNEQTK